MRTKAGKDGLFRKQKRRADGSIYESPTWWCRFQINGRDITRSTRETSRRAAAQAARRIRAELEEAAPAGARTGLLTLRQMGEWDKAAKRRKGVSAGQESAIRYAWQHLERLLGTTDPKRLDYALIAAYIDRRLEEGRSGSSIRKELQALKRGIKHARLRHHPIPRLENGWPEVPTTEACAKQSGSYHEPDVLRRWLEELKHPSDPVAASKRSPQAYTQAALILHTGLRVEEARRLVITWVEPAEDDDEVAAYIRVPKWAAKTRRERSIAITMAVVDVLLDAVERVDEGAPLCPGDYRTAWASAQRRIGYTATITPRDLRHCYATIGTLGGDVVSVQTAMGHTDLRTTSRYVHGTDARTRKASLTVSAVLGGRDPSAGTPPEPEGGPAGETAEGTVYVNSRGGWIRTSDRLLPKPAYRAMLEVLATHRGAEWVAEALSGASSDPARGVTPRGHASRVAG